MIYIQRNGKEHGPYNDSEAAAYLQNGQLLANDLARTDSDRGWRPLREVLAGPVVAKSAPAQPAVVYAAPSAPVVGSPGQQQQVVVVDVKMPFGSMVVFMIKWMLASIPAFIILWIILAVVGVVVSLVFGGLFGGFQSMLRNH